MMMDSWQLKHRKYNAFLLVSTIVTFAIEKWHFAWQEKFEVRQESFHELEDPIDWCNNLESQQKLRKKH